ncbi:MAG: hypothetical protein KW802_03680 [Candidatus Doudnabacteria bacterium]|nr:hypothetical protein [Candidatus Doudnabacteria bacterium]
MSIPTNKLAILTMALAFVLAPTTIGADFGDIVVGNTCLVPIIHTNFMFPPEGGKIVKIGDQMYFVQSYRPECANAGANGVLIKGSQNGVVAGSANAVPQENVTQTKSNCLDQLR